MSIDGSDQNQQGNSFQNHGGIKRRDVLLGGTTLLAATALSGVAFPGLADAQAQSLTSTQALEIPTTGTLQTMVGPLEVENGFPTNETVAKLYDVMDHQRATQAYLWALPYVSMGEWQREQRETFGAGDLDYVDYLDFKDKLGLLTANATTPYTMAFQTLRKPARSSLRFPPER